MNSFYFWESIASKLPHFSRFLLTIAALFIMSYEKVQSAETLARSFDILPCTPSTNANLTINGGTPSLHISVGTLSTMAGAISSLKLNGTETVDIGDHGREIQYAIQLNGGGEANNPTEAGAAGDGGYTKPSSSQFIEGCAKGNVLYTYSRMANWLPINGQKLSTVRLAKIVEIGSHGMPNVISLISRFTYTKAYESAQIEIPTGYQRGDFNKVYLYDTFTQTYAPPGPGELEEEVFGVFPIAYRGQKIPILWNGKFAVIPYSPTSKKFFWAYGGSYAKWSQVIGRPGWTPNNMYARNYIIVSTSVESSVNDLKNLISKTIFDKSHFVERIPITTPTPKPSPQVGNAIPGDITGDGKVNIFDFNKLVANFGNPYTIFDFNTIIANFGK